MKKIMTFLAIIWLLIAVTAIVPSNKDIIAPGGLTKVESLIEVEGDYEISGSFNTIYVYSMERVSVLAAAIASLIDGVDVSDSSSSVNLSDEENILSGQIQKNQSIEASLICAYTEANKVNSNITIESEFKGYIVYIYQINNEIFEMGDIITAVYDNSSDKTYNSSNMKELANAINNLTINDKIMVVRNGKDKELTVEKEFSNENLNRFACYEKYEIKSASPAFNLQESTTLGPSGGLLQTLSIYSQITGIDLTYGKKIAGTGTIEVDGTVGPIGGINQKIITAINNNADVFLCPSYHYKDAYETYMKTKNHEKMVLIEVSTFADAVAKLNELYGN